MSSRVGESSSLNSEDDDNFCSIFGWYFDGNEQKTIYMKPEYAKYYNEMIADREAKEREMKVHGEETFTDMVNRNFWPPQFMGSFFRTRGTYPDIKKNLDSSNGFPPAPPAKSYEIKRPIIKIWTKEDDPVSFSEHTKLDAQSIIQQNVSDKNLFYWDEFYGDFLPKVPEDEYEWDAYQQIWIQAEIIARTPYDWYFDYKQGKFFLRSKARRGHYAYDPTENIFCKHKTHPKLTVLSPKAYCYDEKAKVWRNISDFSSDQIRWDEFGKRYVKPRPSATGLSSDDYYFDAKAGKMKEKTLKEIYSYYLDIKELIWREEGQGYGPGINGHYSKDYFFDEDKGAFELRPPEECYQIGPYDWYFHEEKGKFCLRDRLELSNYTFDQRYFVWTLEARSEKRLQAANKITDFYYDEECQDWRLIQELSFEDARELKHHTNGKRTVKVGPRGASGTTPDDWYYDGVKGHFMKRNEMKVSEYFYDEWDEVFRKKQQPHGPGLGKFYAFDYYWNKNSGEWFPSHHSQEAVKKRRRTEVHGTYMGPYDWYFCDLDGNFFLRDTTTPENYEYNEFTGVYHVCGMGGNSAMKALDFYYDEFSGHWMFRTSSSDEVYYQNGKRWHVPSEAARGSSGYTTDDYYYDPVTLSFHVKNPEVPPDFYSYCPNEGVWKTAEQEANTMGSPNDYCFSDTEGKFIPKSEIINGEIYLDVNTNLWRIKKRTPLDFYWDSENKKYRKKDPNNHNYFEKKKGNQTSPPTHPSPLPKNKGWISRFFKI